MKIYTKTGDKGKSSLYTGERIFKSDHVFECLGTLDELNAHIGLAREYCQAIENLDKQYPEQLATIQSRIFDVGAQVATNQKSDEEKKIEKTKFDPEIVLNLEHWIDEMDTQIKPLKFFILPSGGFAACNLQIARSVCRRAERRLVPLYQDEQIEQGAYQFINRLSDYLFTLARFCTQVEGKSETIWRKETPKKKKEDEEK